MLENVRVQAELMQLSLWVSLRYFSITRLVIAVVLLGAVVLSGGTTFLGETNPPLFFRTAIVYAVLAMTFVYFAAARQTRFNAQLLAQLLVDLTVLTLMMHLSAGVHSGFAILFLLPVAGAALLSTTLWALGFAALSALAILAEMTWRSLDSEFNSSLTVEAGLYGAVCFAIAMILNRLAGRLLAQEHIAVQRGADLQSQLEINRLVVRDMPDGVLILGDDGWPRALNPAACRMLGIDNSDLAVRQGWNGHELGELIGEHFRSWHSGLGDQGMSETFEFLASDSRGDAGAKLHDGARRLRARFLAPQSASSTTTNHVVVLEDLKRLEERAQQLKLASMGRLTASIAHEIRNPLAAISHAGALLAEAQLDDASRRLVEIVNTNTRRLDRIVENILQLSRRGQVQTEDIEVDPFVRLLADEFCRDQNCPRELVELSIYANPTVRFNSDHLRQIILNLLLNARRFASGLPGSVAIIVVPVVNGPIQMHASQPESTQARSERIEFIVQDDGQGIEPGIRDHLFEPFFTTHHRGTGLGLFLARELCLANGATLSYVPNMDQSKKGGFVVNAAGRLL